MSGGRITHVDLACATCGAIAEHVPLRQTAGFVVGHEQARVTACYVRVDGRPGVERWTLLQGRG